MRNYKFKRKTDWPHARSIFNEISNYVTSFTGLYFTDYVREHFLLGSKSLSINCNDTSYSLFDSVHSETVEEGKYQYLGETYIFCSEDVIPYMYK